MSEGPISAGSIRGELKLDASDWMEKLSAADAAARKLGAASPTVRVEAKVDEAIAKLAAVDAAQKKLDLSTASLKLAYQRLDEVQTKGGASQSRLMAAHLAAQRAELAHEAATRKLAAAQAQEAAETDKAASATERLNSANGNGIQRWQLMAAAIAALIPLLAPLAGYAVGVGGALGAMGGAGVLAIYGIVKAIKDSTVAGVAYQRGLDQLKSSLDSLGSTAANRMLSSLGIAVSIISTALPTLNNQVGVFAGYAGRIGTTLLQGVINALQVLNPLFVQGAGYVEQLASGFAAWTSNGGLERFTTYTTQVFPQVAATLGSLATLALHVAEGFSVWGGPMLGAIKAVSDALNFIPAPLLPALAAGAFAVVAAFRTWSAISATVDGVSGSLQKAGTSGKAAFASIIQGVLAADAAILQGTASIASGIKQWQGLTTSSDGWSEAVRKGNININNLGRTLQSVGGFWNDFAKNADIAGTTVRPLYDNVKSLDQAIASATPEDAARAYKQLQEQMKLAGHSSSDMATLFPAATAAVHAQQQASKEAAAAARDNAQGLDDASTSAKKTQDAMTKLNDTLKNLGSDQLNASAAAIAFHQSIADATQAIKDNGATLDETTQKGRDNRKALDDIAQSGIALVAANQQAGTSTGELSQQMQSARDQFINAAVQMGINTDQANKMADQYGLVPKNVDTAFNTSGAAAAAAAAAAVKAAYDAVERSITIRVNTIETRSTLSDLNGSQSGSGRMGTYRDGGTIHAATGLTVPGVGSSGIDSVHAMLAPSEEVISNRFGQADRNRNLLKMVNAGAGPRELAAYMSRQAGGGGAPQPVNVAVTVQSKGGIDLSQYIDVRAGVVTERTLAQLAQQMNGGLVI
ncbi:hypothetical protein [Leifsonia sp. 22587]|uniref:hypothetical protein n=1 Tax=Leifsonia sp. 22587 TaxID=3453946 RepID=UPI003F864692